MNIRIATVFALLSSGLAGSCVVAGDLPGIPAQKLKQAEATYADVFGATHEKLTRTGKPSEKGEFAKKLFERSKESGADPAMQEVLRRNALAFAQNDPAGIAIALEIHKAYLAVPNRKAAALEKIAEWNQRGMVLEPPANRPKLAAEVVMGFREAAAEWDATGHPTAAVAANAKARAAARKYTPSAKEVFAALDADDRRLQPLAAEQSEFERLKAAVEKSPDDAKARLALGLAHLKHRRWPDAAEQFAAADADEWAALAKALAAKPVSAEAVAAAAAKAAAALPADDRKGRYLAFQLAEQRYEEAMLADEGAAARLRPAYLAVLEKLAPLDPPAHAGKHALSLAQGLLDAADEQAVKKDAAALATLAKARAALKGVKAADAKELLAEIDAAEKTAKSVAALDADVAKYAEEARVGLLNAKSGLVYGLALLRLGRPADAATPLGKADGKTWHPLAKLLADPMASPFAVGEALRAAAVELKGDERTALLALARERYEAFLAAVPKDTPERTRIGLMVKELPTADTLRPTRKAADVLDLFADPVAAAKWFQDGTPKETGTVELKTDGGRFQLAVRGKYSQCAIPAERQPVIVEAPSKPGEHRFVGFWYRKQDGDNIEVCLRKEAYPQVVYGTLASGQTADQISIRTAEKAPVEWQFVTRDLYADFGKPAKVGTLIVLNQAVGTSFLGPVIFGKTAAAVRAAGNRPKPR